MSSGTTNLNCAYCGMYRPHLLTTENRHRCLSCGTFYGETEPPAWTPSAQQERDFRILRWRAKWGNDLMDDNVKVWGTLEEQCAELTQGLAGPTPEEAKL